MTYEYETDYCYIVTKPLKKTRYILKKGRWKAKHAKKTKKVKNKKTKFKRVNLSVDNKKELNKTLWATGRTVVTVVVGAVVKKALNKE